MRNRRRAVGFKPRANGQKLRASFSDVLRHYSFPLSLSFQDVLDCITQRAIPSGVGGNVMRFFFHFGAGVGDGDGEARNGA